MYGHKQNLFKIWNLFFFFLFNSQIFTRSYIMWKTTAQPRTDTEQLFLMHNNMHGSSFLSLSKHRKDVYKLLTAKLLQERLC